jgi:putative transposase
MTTRFEKISIGEFYHIYNRGTDKRIIFNDDLDYRRFVELLFLSNMSEAVNLRDIRKVFDSVFDFERSDPLVHIGAYCLMPNHFHILLTPAVENGVHMFMLKLATGYSMYFNNRNNRTGALFQGKFKSQHANSDEYLKYLFAYIHLNPVKLIQPDWKENGIRDIEKVKHYLDKYTYSSLKDYFGTRKETAILDPKKFPEYFREKSDIDRELIDWLNYDVVR